MTAYRGLVAYYKSCNKQEEAAAFEELMQKIHDSLNHEEQRKDNSSDSGVSETSGTQDSSG